MGLGPQPQLLDYNESIDRMVANYYLGSAEKYFGEVRTPTLQGYRRWLSESTDEREYLRGVIGELTRRVVISIVREVAMRYEPNDGTYYTSSIERLESETAGSPHPHILERYSRLRDSLLEGTSVGQLLREGRYRDARDVVLRSPPPEVLAELRPLLHLLPAADYTGEVESLFEMAAREVDPSLRYYTLRRRLEPWLLDRLERQYWDRIPTRQELEDYWRSPGNLAAILEQRQEVQGEVWEQFLGELLDASVNRYSGSSTLVRNLLNDGEVHSRLDISDFHGDALQALRSDPDFTLVLQRYQYQVGLLLDDPRGERIYREIVGVLRRHLGITTDLIVDHVLAEILRRISHDEDTYGVVGRSIAASEEAELVLTGWLRERVVEAIGWGDLTEEDSTVDTFWDGLQDPESGLLVVVGTAVEVAQRDIVGVLVGRSLVHLYAYYDRELHLLLLDLVAAVDGSDLYRKYQRLLDTTTPVVMGSGIGELIRTDPAGTRDTLEEDVEVPSPVLGHLEEIANDLRVEAALYQAVGRNLTSHLVESGVVVQLEPPPPGTGRHSVVLDLRHLVPLVPGDGIELQELLEGNSPLTYRDSTILTLRRASRGGYEIILYGIPPLTSSATLDMLRASLPGVQLVVLPWDTPDWREVYALEQLLEESVVPDPTSVLLVTGSSSTTPTVPTSEMSGHQRTLATRLDVLWFTSVELFPTTYDVRQLSLTSSRYNLLLLAPIGVSLREMVGGMGLPSWTVVAGDWGHLTPTEPGEVVVLDITSNGTGDLLTLDVDLVVQLLGQLVDISGEVGVRLNTRLVWSCVNARPGSTGGPPVVVSGDYRGELLPLLDGPPVRYEP